MNEPANQTISCPHCIDCQWLDTSFEDSFGDFCRRTGSVPKFVDRPRTTPACIHFSEASE